MTKGGDLVRENHRLCRIKHLVVFFLSLSKACSINFFTLTNYTREEFLDIFRKAKARKTEWQKQVENELNEMPNRIADNRSNAKQIIN